jgi:AAHS family 4-hydroxybenzoate transporter-like MFS transporter
MPLPISSSLDHDLGYAKRLFDAPMSRYQIVAVAVTIALCGLDGFDVFSITFAAPMIGHEWGIGKAALGIVFSAGLGGMALGSLFLAPFADRFGRRRLVVSSLLLMACGTAWTAAAQVTLGLAVSRLVTGLGVGAMIAVINPLAAEYANGRRRDLSVTLLNLGFPIGGMVGGAISALLMPDFGWRSIFVAASGITVAMLILVLLALPEPIVGLLARPKHDSLARINRYLSHCDVPPLLELPAYVARRRSTVLLRGPNLIRTARVTAIYFLFVMSIFYIQSWIPSLVAAAGYTPSAATVVSVFMNAGGVAGGLVIGLASPSMGLKLLVGTAFLGSAITIALFGIVPPSITILTMMAGIIGVFTIGGMAGFYAVVSRCFPVEARASGTGLVIGIGRLGSAISPALGGLMFSLGVGRAEVTALMGLPALLAAGLLVALTPYPTEGAPISSQS